MLDEAVLDGVEMRAAPGFLIEQSLRAKSTNRTDEHGGSTEISARFALDIADAVSEAVGEDRGWDHQHDYVLSQSTRLLLEHEPNPCAATNMGDPNARIDTHHREFSLAPPVPILRAPHGAA